MTRGVANAEENGAIFFPGPTQGLFSPWIPFDRIMGMLEEIRAGFMNQAVCIFVIHSYLSSSGVFITIKRKNDKENPLDFYR
jgi:hypothetical protein